MTEDSVQFNLTQVHPQMIACSHFGKPCGDASCGWLHPVISIVSPGTYSYGCQILLLLGCLHSLPGSTTVEICLLWMPVLHYAQWVSSPENKLLSSSSFKCPRPEVCWPESYTVGYAFRRCWVMSRALMQHQESDPDQWLSKMRRAI
jgi:hypothetical protein